MKKHDPTTMSPQDAYHARIKAQAANNRAARQGKKLIQPKTLIARVLQEKQAAAANAAAEANSGGAPQGTAYELMLAQLAEHRRVLKGIQSLERKIEAKRAFLPMYYAWISGALEADSPANDLVLTTVMVWLVDVGDYGGAWAIAKHALKHGLPLPDQYDRDLPTVLIDEFADAALAGKMDAALALQLLADVLSETGERDAPDQARAKLHKALGYAHLGKLGKATSSEIDFEQLPNAPLAVSSAHAYLLRALELDEKSGVKKDIERVERWLKKAGAPGA
ncbi:phage terminase small subunit [Leptospira sp. 96542]|nr:phage terminase small subunit [Leptospira sp. 96542]